MQVLVDEEPTGQALVDEEVTVFLMQALMDEEATGQALVDEEEVYLLLRKEMHLTDNIKEH